MKDLFTLGDDEEAGTETGDIFSGTGAKEIKAGTTNKGDGGSTDVQNQEAATKSNENGSASILNSLLDDSNDGTLHSAINHDAIIDAGTNEKDVSLMEFEADKVAEEALAELKRSGRQRRRQGVAVPTWTGKSGLAGLFGNSSNNSGGSRASALLQKMKQREGHGAGVVVGQSASGSSSREDLIADIIDFLKEQGGECTSAQIIQHFEKRVAQEAEEQQRFKAMLKKVAVLVKAERPKKSFWKLRDGLGQD